MTGVPISTEGKTSACAHSDLAGNLIASVCDLWSNEAVEYHDMFGATTTSVFAETKKLPKEPDHPLFKLFPDFVDQLKPLQ